MQQLSLNAKQSMTRGSMGCQGEMVSLLPGLDTRRMKTASMSASLQSTGDRRPDRGRFLVVSAPRYNFIWCFLTVETVKVMGENIR